MQQSNSPVRHSERRRAGRTSPRSAFDRTTDPGGRLCARPEAHMSRPPQAGRPAAAKTRPINMPSGPKLPITDFIRRQLVTVAERDRQRSRLVNVLIVALALLTAATIPGYWGTPNAALALVPLGAALAIYLAAFLANGVFKRTAASAYVLVIGGGLALAAQAIGLAAAGSATEASHAALLLSAVILIAGLLFVP